MGSALGPLHRARNSFDLKTKNGGKDMIIAAIVLLVVLVLVKCAAKTSR